MVEDGRGRCYSAVALHGYIHTLDKLHASSGRGSIRNLGGKLGFPNALKHRCPFRRSCDRDPEALRADRRTPISLTRLESRKSSWGGQIAGVGVAGLM
jgi:hypothetical protein